MKKLFRQKAKPITVFLASESETDPYEHTIELLYLNPIPIKAMIAQISPEKMVWRFYGKKVSEAKELIIEQNNLNLIRMSYKIEIEGTEFLAYNDKTANFSIELLDDNYARVVLWRP